MYDTGKGISTKLSVYIVLYFDMDIWLIKINVKLFILCANVSLLNYVKLYVIIIRDMVVIYNVYKKWN